MDSHNFERLKAHILPLSLSQDFDVARREWGLVAVEISDEWDHCPCGQDIKEHCYIRNRMTGREAERRTVMIDATYLKAHRTASSLGVKKGVSGD